MQKSFILQIRHQLLCHRCSSFDSCIGFLFLFRFFFCLLLIFFQNLLCFFSSKDSICFYKASDFAGLYINPAVLFLFQYVAYAFLCQSPHTAGFCIHFLFDFQIILGKCVFSCHCPETEILYQLWNLVNLLICNQLFVGRRR